jgi:hypothetical protein
MTVPVLVEGKPMAEVVLDQGTLAKLDQFLGRVKIVDEAGRVRGYFVPGDVELAGEEGEPDLTPDEIERILKEPGGRTLAEILTDLEKRP